MRALHSFLQGASACCDVGFSMDCSVDICSGTAEGISSLAPAAPPPSSFSLTWVSAGQFLSHVLTPLLKLLCSVFYPFLSTSAQRHTSCATDGLSFGQCWGCQSQLCMAVSSTAQPHVLFQRGHPAAPPATQTVTRARSPGWKLDRQSLLLTTLSIKFVKSTVNFSSQNEPLL